MMSKPIESNTKDNLFLPQFCEIYTVFVGVIVTELLAFVIVFAQLNKTEYGWHTIAEVFLPQLAMISLLMQWVTLGSMGLLCAIRRHLQQLDNNVIAGVISYLLILLVTAVVSEGAYRLNLNLLGEPISFIVTHQWLLLKNVGISALGSAFLLGYLYHRWQWKKSLLMLSYVVIVLATFWLTELASFFQAAPAWRQQVAEQQIFFWHNLGISAILSAIILHYFYVQYYWRTETEVNANARAQALQARIRPHFLFNSLNSIATLIYSQPTKAEQAILDLADLFRASLVDAKQGITFAEELGWCQQYLNMETLRLGERLHVIWNVATIPPNAILPPLCLQPLLENAIYHGIQPLETGGTINITGLFEGSRIQITIDNPLPPTVFKHQGHQLAQQNIQQRLQLFFGTQAKLNVDKHLETYHVSLIFPYRQKKL
jgi:two-component system sensor histidine kinase AlgZ